MSSGVGDDGSDVFRFEVLRGKKKKKIRISRAVFWTEVQIGKKEKEKKKKKQSCVLDQSAKRQKKKKKMKRKRAGNVLD